MRYKCYSIYRDQQQLTKDLKMTSEQLDELSLELNKVIDKVEGCLDKELIEILKKVSYDLYVASEK